MIVFVFGTTAEAIKLAPIMRRLDARGVAYEQWVTFQHTDALRVAMPQLGLRAPDRVIADGWRGQPLKRPVQMLGWMLTVGGWTLRRLVPLRRSLPRRTIVVVHGDTMTTVLGAVMGQLLGRPVAHVEAGLRSGDWRHPFPEELDRRIVGRLARVHYAPTAETAENLRGRPNVVTTHGNTVKDAVRDSLADDDGASGQDHPYGLVLLHRFEFISNPSLVRETLRTLDAHSPLELRVVVDSYSKEAIEQAITELALDRMVTMPKLEHKQFVDVLRGATFVVTDSGGIQEETAVFGIPTLIHRMATERSEGVGTSAVLSRWDQTVVADFLRDAERLRTAADAIDASPSDIIVDDLLARGFGKAGD